MADSVVTFLLAKLSSLLAEELKVLGGVKGDLVFIKDELEGLRAFLRVADAMERSDPVLQTWVKQVRDVTYDTDDVLEEFMLRLASYHRRGLNGFLCKIYYEIKSMKLHRQIAYEIRDITVRVTVIKQRHQRYNSSFSTLEQGLSSHAANNAWYDRRDVWDAIKIALRNSNCGSHVLLTTCIGNVASISCRKFNGYVHKMEALSKEESWILFCKKTFQEKDCPPHLKELSESILQRCEGLPLAIVAIAGVLASKDQGRANEWDYVNRSIGAELEGNYMMKIEQFTQKSYDRMDELDSVMDRRRICGSKTRKDTRGSRQILPI
ncbi:hypothetical protein ACSBR2_037303 [Camellia fascicularis]